MPRINNNTLVFSREKYLASLLPQSLIYVMELAEKYGVEYWANHLDGVPMKQCLKRNYIVFEQDCITYKEWKEAHK